MANFIVTPNMNLPNPVPGVDPGPDYANNLQSSLNVIDQHNHASGSGVQINPTGIDINSDLSFNGNNIILVRSVRFQAQASPLSGANDLGCLYVFGVDLYYNDENGNQVQITSGGTVNATSSGISSGTATASFVSSVLVVNAASNTPANIKGGSILLGNNVSGSKYLTLSPPSAMASSYSLVLPSVPGSTLFMTLDSSGNMGTASSIQASQIASASITGSQIASATITGTNIASDTITFANQVIKTASSSTASAGNVAVSASCGTYGYNGSTFQNVTNLSVTLTTLGGPVFIGLTSVGTSVQVGGLVMQGDICILNLLRGGSSIMQHYYGDSGTSAGIYYPPPGVLYIDTPSAGTYTYSIQVNPNGSQTNINELVLVAYEL